VAGLLSPLQKLRGAASSQTQFRRPAGFTKQARHRICYRGHERRRRHTRTPARLRPAAAQYPSPRFRSGKKSARRIWFERISRNGRYRSGWPGPTQSTRIQQFRSKFLPRPDSTVREPVGYGPRRNAANNNATAATFVLPSQFPPPQAWSL
jgi:hypothetical protein